MKLSKIQDLLRLVAESGVSEVEIEEEDFKMVIRKNTPQVIMQPSYPQYGAPQQYGSPQQFGGGQQFGGMQGGGMQGGMQGSAPPSSFGGGAQQQAPAQGGSAPQGGGASTSGTASDDGGGDPADDKYVVKAPIVGTFYRCPNPDAEPFVSVGDSVSEGDVLCIIEAMKLMNEIEVETSGTITEILVEDAEPVEFDQPLFLIDEK